MLYPFIYTRTKYHDYRVVTSESLSALPATIVDTFTNVARTMINADNIQLEKPSWALVKKNCYTLWGMAAMNSVLGNVNIDKGKRPVRGFFGFISDEQVDCLPYSISFFIEIYKIYVEPIWDTFEQSEQICCGFPELSGDDFITGSSLIEHKINAQPGISRLFPYGIDSKELIEAVLASSSDCSIATNIHNSSNCIEFGDDKLSFMNIVGAADSDIRDIKDVKVYKKNEPATMECACTGNSTGFVDGFICPDCDGKPADDETVSTELVDLHPYRRYLKYGLYALILLGCIVIIIKGPKIWKAILKPEQNIKVFIPRVDTISHRDRKNHGIQTNPFLNTEKDEIHIQNNDHDDNPDSEISTQNN